MVMMKGSGAVGGAVSSQRAALRLQLPLRPQQGAEQQDTSQPARAPTARSRTCPPVQMPSPSHSVGATIWCITMRVASMGTVDGSGAADAGAGGTGTAGRNGSGETAAQAGPLVAGGWSPEGAAAVVGGGRAGAAIGGRWACAARRASRSCSWRSSSSAADRRRARSCSRAAASGGASGVGAAAAAAEGAASWPVAARLRASEPAGLDALDPIWFLFDLRD